MSTSMNIKQDMSKVGRLSTFIGGGANFTLGGYTIVLELEPAAGEKVREMARQARTAKREGRVRRLP